MGSVIAAAINLNIYLISIIRPSAGKHHLYYVSQGLRVNLLRNSPYQERLKIICNFNGEYIEHVPKRDSC